MALLSRFHPAAVLAAFAVLSVPSLPAAAQAVAPDLQQTQRAAAANPCSAAAKDDARRGEMALFLRSHGLALQWRAVQGAKRCALVVLDPVTASEVLRGPLAEGERVETGSADAENSGGADADAVADADTWAPDVHFNRRWLASVMAKHQLVQAAAGRSEKFLIGTSRPVRMAAR